jgi:hypothetical protein
MHGTQKGSQLYKITRRTTPRRFFLALPPADRSDLYLRDYVGCKFPVEGEVAEDAFVQLLDELHEQGVRIHLVVEEGQQILLIALGLLQVVVRQRAEVRALVQIFETDLRRLKKIPIG